MTTTESDTSTNEQQLRDAGDAFTDSLKTSGAPPGTRNYFRTPEREAIGLRLGVTWERTMSPLLRRGVSSLCRCLLVPLCLSLLFSGLGGGSLLGPPTLVFASHGSLSNFL